MSPCTFTGKNCLVPFSLHLSFGCSSFRGFLCHLFVYRFRQCFVRCIQFDYSFSVMVFFGNLFICSAISIEFSYTDFAVDGTKTRGKSIGMRMHLLGPLLWLLCDMCNI